ncbi:MAG: hypothetical protein P8164_04350 [Gammaproteobacteria bacterium]|jgi:hypothetical protein
MNRMHLMLILAAMLCCHNAGAEERLKLKKTTILGNGELPRVTFVIPWRDAPSAIPQWKPSPSAHPHATPLDRDVYRRQLEYLRQLRHHKGESDAR